jgi:hypothetical protein
MSTILSMHTSNSGISINLLPSANSKNVHVVSIDKVSVILEFDDFHFYGFCSSLKGNSFLKIHSFLLCFHNKFYLTDSIQMC